MQVPDAVRNETLSECRAPDTEPIVDWNAFLRISERVKAMPEVRVPGVVSSVSADEEESEAEEETSRSSRYDLAPSKLALLRKTTKMEANRCRKVGRRSICGETRSKGLCYRAVKFALAKAGMVSAHWSEAYAIQAHARGSLAKRGFKNVMSEGYNSRSAPLGAILVYSGGPRKYGHIEIRLNKNEYCSDFCKANPVDVSTRGRRKLVGIYVKP